jgi:hypothetical protein
MQVEKCWWLGIYGDFGERKAVVAKKSQGGDLSDVSLSQGCDLVHKVEGQRL